MPSLQDLLQKADSYKQKIPSATGWRRWTAGPTARSTALQVAAVPTAQRGP